jgi:hypothetical protein
MALTVKGIDDQEGFGQVHDARMVVKGKRIAVEKQRKVYKEDALKFGKMVDSEAKKIFDALEPIESHLQTQEDVIINEKKRIAAEKERAEQERILWRINELASVACVMSYFDVASLSDPEYEKLFSEKKAIFEAEQVRIAEEKRLESERLEKERLDREAEQKRLDAERAELNRIKAEQDAERAKLKAEQDKIDAEKRAIEDAKRKAQEKADREVFEKQALENARVAAEKAANEKAEREAREKAEAEQKAKEEAERQEALAPDKDKLFTFANRLFKFKNDIIPTLPFGSPAVAALAKAELAIDKAIKTLIKEAKEL